MHTILKNVVILQVYLCTQGKQVYLQTIAILAIIHHKDYKIAKSTKVLHGLNSLGGVRFSKPSIPLLMKFTSLASLMADKTSSLLGPP